MEDNRKRDERRLRRCYQCNRLEEELLAMVYGEVWPLVRRVLTVQQLADSVDQRRSGFVSKQKIGA
ncbi:MAG: hypothetical protein QGF59_11340 [Pirellulaceae bacterium]|jgi:hypothetical protein|nr:hypothetical protein [Pirellulaceae bacterium]